MAPVTRAVAAAAVAAVLVAAGILFALGVALHADQATRHDLCTIVGLVTAHPVPRPSDPAANPSRETAWRFYTAFVVLGGQYGCH